MGTVRTEAMHIAERKLSGDRLQQAKKFIFARRRMEGDLKALTARLSTLPDIACDPAARVKLRSLSAADIERMRADRVAGAAYRELAEKYGVSESSAWRYCNEPGPA
jgi:DNA invertase Pin-like site-specific DNA recombinase